MLSPSYMITVKDFYLVRTPLQSIQFLDQFEQVDMAALPGMLKALFQDPAMQEAIYIASPELHQELMKWLQGGAGSEKMCMALYRYVLRMSTRCTPYGLFAGCATGHYSAATAIEIGHAHKKHCRLDMNYVAELAAMITQLPEIKVQLRYFPNNSIYPVADTFRYAGFTVKNKFRHYELAAVSRSPYLETLLSVAGSGATIAALCAAIVDDEITEDDAREFIDELIENQLLVSELEPTVTGEEFFSYLLQRLSTLSGTTAITATLKQIQQLLSDPATGVDKYLHTHALVQELLPDTRSKDLVQTDLFLATSQNTISTTLIKDLQDQVLPLWKMARANTNTEMTNFINRFRERYEDQEVPLALALDNEAGIGYGNSQSDHTPLIDDLVITNNEEQTNLQWSQLRSFQLEKLHQCMQEGAQLLTLTDADLETLKSPVPVVLPSSMYLMGSLHGSSASALDAGEYLFEMNGFSGPSSANLLGRFCHGDAQLLAHVKECLREEEQQDPDVIYAEVVHLPEARTGNILMRPQLREYEIVYLGNGSVAVEKQFAITDLMVSVRQNKIVLRSRRYNKRVIPRLSTAHNFARNSLPVYHFLCDLQSHTVTGWQWHLPVQPAFLPRVVYKKIVLGKATWHLQKGADLKALQLPRYITIMEGDNELYIDRKNAVSMQLLQTMLEKKEKITVQEVIGTPDQCWIKGTGGRFTNEVIIPFANKVTVSPLVETVTQEPIRRFITGSEWLYIKLYGGSKTAEDVLTTVVAPLIAQVEAAQLADKWFFIRYNDPDHHIRLRFHNSSDPVFWQRILHLLYEQIGQYQKQELIYKVQTDTYVREIERYGVDTMEFSEQVFYADSKAVLNCICQLEGEDGERYRWLLGARGVDVLLQDFGYDLAARAAIMKVIREGFFREFGGSQELQTQLNSKYRQEMRQLSSFLDPSQDEENGIAGLFDERSDFIREIVPAGIAADYLLPSYIHMFLNRILLTGQRKHELVLYHFLSKYYDSQLAIQKKKQTT
ncbi:thiopeptide-type bacteriocin biosynthesis domain-containing protein [Chitinophaga sancti]|uniref:Thiopeptide-type bacteriocin biosynthesis domain-containing protein n=2 Tax=Chitinophaga sancti TaxID=1004 RepID=A0A1K1Q4S7_9BACT|nr:thiopeptide-type bacteriocin biosynthesis domain-containing protein [Chitinophaga sancti]